jgi:hypothetical protein
MSSLWIEDDFQVIGIAEPIEEESLDDKTNQSGLCLCTKRPTSERAGIASTNSSFGSSQSSGHMICRVLRGNVKTKNVTIIKNGEIKGRLQVYRFGNGVVGLVRVLNTE